MYDQNHGIKRALPKVYKDHSLNLKIHKVTNQVGQNIPYTKTTQNKNLVLLIGDPNLFVHGKQTYVIEYEISNIISFFDDYDEWFWDINGDQWGQITESVSTTITFDKSLAGTLLPTKKCYTGNNNSKQSDCTIKEQSDNNSNNLIIKSNRKLNANETLSVVVGFKKGTFSKPLIDIIKDLFGVFIIMFSVLLPIIVIIIMLLRWFKVGRDPKGKGVIIPQYQPIDNINPLVSSVVLFEQMKPLAISASIVDLCIKGYIKIYETSKKKLFGTKKEYELELSKLPENLSIGETKIINMLFPTRTIKERININQQKNKLYTQVKDLQETVEQQAVEAGLFATTPTKTKNNYLTKMAIGFVLCGLLVILNNTLLDFKPIIFLAVSIAISSLLIGLMSKLMPAKTKKGVTAKEHLLGLKEYMELAEADRIKTLQSPSGVEKTPVIDVKDTTQLIKLYEKLIPYAIIFEIEEEWTKQIAPLYSQPPDWYAGTGTFNSALFASTISNINSVSTSSFSAPSSSSSSGFSGGGAGGGGGGGGGGGW